MHIIRNLRKTSKDKQNCLDYVRKRFFNKNTEKNKSYKLNLKNKGIENRITNKKSRCKLISVSNSNAFKSNKIMSIYKNYKKTLPTQKTFQKNKNIKSFSQYKASDKIINKLKSYYQNLIFEQKKRKLSINFNIIKFKNENEQQNIQLNTDNTVNQNSSREISIEILNQTIWIRNSINKPQKIFHQIINLSSKKNIKSQINRTSLQKNLVCYKNSSTGSHHQKHIKNYNNLMGKGKLRIGLSKFISTAFHLKLNKHQQYKNVQFLS